MSHELAETFQRAYGTFKSKPPFATLGSRIPKPTIGRRTLTASLQTASTDAMWNTATIDELLQGGELSLPEGYYIVEARVPAREFLLRRHISRNVVEQDMREAVDLLVQLLNTRVTHAKVIIVPQPILEW